MKKRMTKQKILIYENLMNRFDHPTAEMVFDNVKKKTNTIGLTTVYRNLLELVKNNLAIKINSPEGVVHFDRKCCDHFHMICSSCSEIIDVDCSYISLEKIENEIGYQVDVQELTVLGKCIKCLKKEKENE